ncbi:hypothetical protein K438DRAFT_1965405 [Mycena galopus ATCC 62051]|nr:hypothetical protein K438DRAFT_1965405 [Mycena galopus ATCC 62051]
MATYAAILDDRDPLIDYAGTWTGAGSSSEFYGTTTFSPEPGSTASLSFVGTSVTVFGTIGVANAANASMAFVVDGSVTGIYVPPSNITSAIHHQALWESPILSTGTHTLVIVQAAAPASTSGVIFLDYIMYNTTSTSQTYFIDDRDARITYTPQWVHDGSDEDFQHTSQRTSAAGDSFTLEFEGQSISYWGGMTSQTMNASVIIDGGPTTFFGVPVGATTTNNLLFQSGALSAGIHTMVVTAQNDQDLWTDYFLVNPTNTPSSIPAASSSSGSSSSPTSSPSPKPTPVGVIVGCFVAVVVVLVALTAAILLLWRRRRRHRLPPPLPNTTVADAFQPTPFVSFPASGAMLGPQGYVLSAGFNAGYPDYSASSTADSGPHALSTQPPSGLETGMPPSEKLLQESRLYPVNASSGSTFCASCSSPESGREEPPQYTF